MVKKVFSLALMLICLISVNAQTPLPLNPKVKHGVLKNGLNYYIMHNEEPKERANFYIAQKVGSTLETPQQLGLAHFLEHMAFNGSKNFPGKNMLNYLQSKGIRFGQDINAYTAFDETVYNIDNVPTTDKALMDSVLLVLHDWSGSLLLEDAEIDAERGVIQEEWRSRNNVQTRMFTSILPQIYDEYQYTRMPIGTMEVVMNFPYKDLRDYYHKWYRPDQQGIVIVGDFDVEEMEKKVIDLFTTIPMPENAAERVYPSVSDNKDLKYITFQDPEQQYSMVTLSFKYDKTPFEMRSTVENYMQTAIFENLITMMINNRLNEMAQKADCPFSYAGASFGDFWVSKTKGAFDLIVVAKDDIQKAFDTALAELVRSCKTGFTDSELQRVKDELLSGIEKQYNERDKTKTANIAREIIRAFVDNEPSPGIETEYQLMQQVLPMLPVQAMNQAVGQLLERENQVLVIAKPENGKPFPTKEAMQSSINNALDAEYEAYVDEVITDPLIPNMPKAGKIVKTEKIASLGVDVYTLSNGAKVMVKPTDFAADEIMITALRQGGKSEYKGEYAEDLAFINDAIGSSKIGNFDRNRLSKLFAGKNVNLDFFMNMYTSGLNGSSGKKDLESLMQLLYATFTELEADPETYGATLSQYRTMLANVDKNPQKILSEQLNKTWYDNAPYALPLNAAMLDKVNYDNMLKIAKSNLANAADFTFIIVGNVDENTLKPLLEQYVASLPSTGKCTTKAPSYVLRQAKGQVENSFKQPMESPITTVFDVISGTNLKYNVENIVKLDILGDVLSNIFTETLREEEGGTYSPYAFADINDKTGEWYLLYTFSTGADKLDNLNKRAYDETLKLLKNGANAEQFNKVKEAAYKQFEINVKKNRYWMQNLRNYATGNDVISTHEAAIKNLTLDEFNQFMRGMYDGKNRIQVIMNGVEVSK